jgi:hypothetical protein
MIARILTAVALAILIAPLASAQNIEDPLLDHAQENTDAAQRDPVAFVESHASEEAVASEAEWGVAYGCFAVAYAHDEAGTPDPELDQCDQYEEVLGIAPEPEEPVAVVQNVSEDPIAQVEEVTDEAVAAVDEIVEEPLSAPEILIGFVLYVVDKVLDLVGGVGATAADLVGDALDLVGAAFRTDAMLGAAAYDGASGGADAATERAMIILHGGVEGLGELLGAVAGGIGRTATAVGDGMADAAGAVGDAAHSVGTAIADLVGDLFGGEEVAHDKDHVNDVTRQVPIEDAGLLDVVGDLAGSVPG